MLAALLAAPQAGLCGEPATLDIVTASGTHHFQIEVATTEAERETGLMFRRTLAPNAGMLFLYTSPRPIAMWMKNTFLPLDMIFIGKDWRVQRIAKRAEPFTLTPIPSGGPVIAVLEVNAGTVDDIAVEKGDMVQYHPTKAAAE